MPITPYNRAYPQPGAKRRERYHTDPDYRHRAKVSSRRTYRRKEAVEIENCLHSLAFFEQVAQNTRVRAENGNEFSCLTLSVAKTGGVLQVMYQTICRWIRTGMIPPPVLSSLDSKRNAYSVYHVEEVRVLIETIGKHQQTVRYFRKDHKDVVEAIHERINKIREDFAKQ